MRSAISSKPWSLLLEKAPAGGAKTPLLALAQGAIL
jgi:hypothetical protein